MNTKQLIEEIPKIIKSAIFKEQKDIDTLTVVVHRLKMYKDLIKKDVEVRDK